MTTSIQHLHNLTETLQTLPHRHEQIIKCYQMLKAREAARDSRRAAIHSCLRPSTHQNDAAQALLSESLAAAHQGFDQAWPHYVEGTLAYLQNNRQQLQQKIPLSGANHPTLKKLLLGLEERGFPDYLADYGRGRFKFCSTPRIKTPRRNLQEIHDVQL